VKEEQEKEYVVFYEYGFTINMGSIIYKRVEPIIEKQGDHIP